MAGDWRKRQQIAGGLLGGLSAVQLADMLRHIRTGKGQSWIPSRFFSQQNPGAKTGFKPWITSGPTRGSGALIRMATNPWGLGLLAAAYSPPAGAKSDIPDTSFGPIKGITVKKKKKKKSRPY